MFSQAMLGLLARSPHNVSALPSRDCFNMATPTPHRQIRRICQQGLYPVLRQVLLPLLRPTPSQVSPRPAKQLRFRRLLTRLPWDHLHRQHQQHRLFSRPCQHNPRIQSNLARNGSGLVFSTLPSRPGLDSPSPWLRLSGSHISS